MMSSSRNHCQLYPPGGFGAPKDRHGHAVGSVGLPEGTEVFSADNHISLADDIFYERFPDDLKDKAPRIGTRTARTWWAARDRRSCRVTSVVC